MIYRGILAVSRDPEVHAFARHHLASEHRHLAFFEAFLPESAKSRLLPAWRAAGWLTGALPALAGAQAVYRTIAAVEAFVDRHYLEQIEGMARDPRLGPLRSVLAEFREDERSHRDDAACRDTTRPGLIARIWRWMVGAGSAAGVALARRW